MSEAPVPGANSNAIGAGSQPVVAVTSPHGEETINIAVFKGRKEDMDPMAGLKQLQKAPQRIPPGMMPFSRIAAWKWGCAPGAMEVKRQKSLKLAHEHSEAPPTPPAPSQSTQVPAKETLTRKKWRFWCSPISPWLGRVPWGERWGA